MKERDIKVKNISNRENNNDFRKEFEEDDDYNL